MISSFYNALIRRFRLGTQIISILVLYVVGCLSIGIAMAPGFWFYKQVSEAVSGWGLWFQWVAQGASLAVCYFLFGTGLVFLIPLVNLFAGLRLKKWRGSFYSFEGLRWYFHNGLTYLVRCVFLPLITPTPLSNLFYRLMGMKLGKGVVINTETISDPCLIEIGDDTVVGGGATLIAHYAVGKKMVISPVKIGRGVTIGLRATVMAGVRMGDFSTLLPNSVLLPNTLVPARETWGGVPAFRLARGRNS